MTKYILNALIDVNIYMSTFDLYYHRIQLYDLEPNNVTHKFIIIIPRYTYTTLVHLKFLD